MMSAADTTAPQIASPGRYPSGAADSRATLGKGWTERSHAFAIGSDARLAGLPASANPFPCKNGRDEHDYWLLGWRNVDLSWGCAVRGRWPVRELPPVREHAR